MKRASVALSLVILLGPAFLASAGEDGQQDSREQIKKPPRNLAILIFDQVQIIDFTGPYETFGHVYSADQPVPFEIYTVAEKPEAITTAMGMRVVPKYSIENAPKPDILLVPGGGVNSALNSPAVMRWVQEQARGAEIVMSVCNGAFILAKAGLLDGLEATTTAPLIERLKEAAPKTKVVSDKRFVDNGKIITTAGLSSGIDGSLHVIERLYGRGTAEMAALSMEYNWDPQSKFVRAALADKYLPNTYDIEPVVTSWVPAGRRGNTEHWESSWSVGSEASPQEILARMEPSFSNATYFPRAPGIHWVKQSGENTKDQARCSWKYTDEAGNRWSADARIRAVPGERNSYLVSVTVDRANRTEGAVRNN